MKTALVLSGGGIKGAFEAGFCNYIAKKGFVPDFIIGTSVGSINGTMLADGDSFKKNALKLQEHWLRIKRNEIFPLNKKALYRLAWADSILSHKGLRKFFKTNLKSEKFKDLNLPLYINTTNYRTGKGKLFNSGKIIPRVLASLSMPPLFPPININGQYYVDGIINQNCMVEKAISLGAKKVIYVNLLKNACTYSKESFFSHLSQVIYLMEKRMINTAMFPKVDIIKINPKFDGHYTYADFSKISDFVERGKRYGEKTYKDIIKNDNSV